ncbi:hypothetical protein ACJMK2_017981 [Sinanodonta woodiana]|uniref:Glycosyltransferase family 92 protein n=1 Tax=Sinanodonta woodiana TaxID=1069815 RepID=A0ABD3UE29_SINWO
MCIHILTVPLPDNDVVVTVLDNFSDFKGLDIFTQVADTKVFIYSVIGRNTSKTRNPWNEFGVSAWIHSELKPEYIACCFLLDNGIIVKSNHTQYWYYALDVMFTVQYTCMKPKSVLHLTAISLTVSNKTCSSNFSTYVRPMYPSRRMDKETIALCAKQIFGNLRPSLVVTWLEYNKAMGVDKIVTFVNESYLSQNTYKVLKYYKNQGKLVASDEQIFVYFCQDRLAGYSFIGIIDIDEFIFPQKDTNFKELMHYLMDKYTDSASYTFLVECYIRNWGRQNTFEQLVPIEYIQRAAAMNDRVKNIAVRDRFEPGSITTHTVHPRNGFKSIVVPTDVAVLKHYRTCRDDWKPKYDCVNGTGAFQRFTDDSLKKKLEEMIVKDNITLYGHILHIMRYLDVN